MQLISETRPPVRRDRLLRLADVENITGCKQAMLYAMMKQGTFPRPVKLTQRTVAWPESVVLEWVQERIAASNRTAPAGQGRTA